MRVSLQNESLSRMACTRKTFGGEVFMREALEPASREVMELACGGRAARFSNWCVTAA